MLRIRKTRWKIVYIVVGDVLLTLCNGLFLSKVIPRPADAVVANLLTVLLYFGGTRTFRGQGEPVAPPRVWWRMTSLPKAGFVIGVLLSLSFALDLVFAATRPHFLLTYILSAVVDGSLAILYFHSSVRLQRHPPAMVSVPQTLPKWKPIKS